MIKRLLPCCVISSGFAQSVFLQTVSNRMTPRRFLLPLAAAVAFYETERRRTFRDQTCAVTSHAKPSFIRRHFDPRLTWNSDWDKSWREAAWRNRELMDPNKVPASRKILLVRHGQYERGDTDQERILTPLGQVQAKRTGERLAAFLKDKNVKAVICSNMTRAKETAKIILENLPKDIPVYEDPLLAEGYPSFIVPSGRHVFSTPKVQAGNLRIESAFQKYIWRPPHTEKSDTDDWIVLVCHGNVIRYFLCRALQFPTCAWLRFSHPNCGITTLTVSENGYTHTSGFGDAGHLPPGEITYN